MLLIWDDNDDDDDDEGDDDDDDYDVFFFIPKDLKWGDGQCRILRTKGM